MVGAISDCKTEENIPHRIACRALGVSEAWFYKCRRPAEPTKCEARRTALAERIRYVFDRSAKTYGRRGSRWICGRKAGSSRRTSSPRVMAELGLHGRKPPRRRRSLTTCSGAGAGGQPRSALGGELFAHPLTDTLGHGQLITFGPHLRQLLGQLFFERVPFPAPCGDPSSSSGSVYRIVEGHPATESRNRRPPLIIEGSSGASPRRPAPTLTSKKPSPKGGRRLAPPAGLEPAAKRLEGALWVGSPASADLLLLRCWASCRSAFDTHSTSTGGGQG